MATKQRSSPPRFVQLNKEILAAKGATGVLELCGACLSEFDAVNAATSLHRIARHTAGPSTSLIEEPILEELLA